MILGHPPADGLDQLLRGDDVELLVLGPLEDLAQDGGTRDEVALDLALPREAALHAVEPVLVLAGELLVEDGAFLVPDRSDGVLELEGQRLLGLGVPAAWSARRDCALGLPGRVLEKIWSTMIMIVRSWLVERLQNFDLLHELLDMDAVARPVAARHGPQDAHVPRLAVGAARRSSGRRGGAWRSPSATGALLRAPAWLALLAGRSALRRVSCRAFDLLQLGLDELDLLVHARDARGGEVLTGGRQTVLHELEAAGDVLELDEVVVHLVQEVELVDGPGGILRGLSHGLDVEDLLGLVLQRGDDGSTLLGPGRVELLQLSGHDALPARGPSDVLVEDVELRLELQDLVLELVDDRADLCARAACEEGGHARRHLLEARGEVGLELRLHAREL